MNELVDRAYKVAQNFCLVAGEKDSVMRIVRVGGGLNVSLKTFDCAFGEDKIARFDFHFHHGGHVHMAALGTKIVHCAIIDRLSLLDHGAHVFVEGESVRHDILPEDLEGLWKILDNYDGRKRSPAAPVLR